MTHAQWLWEIHAMGIVEREDNEKISMLFNAATRTLVEVLVATLGLRFKDGGGEGDKNNNEIQPFTPLSLLVASGERLKSAQEEAAMDDRIKDSLTEDSPFEAMMQKIEHGDMDPYIAYIEGHGEKPGPKMTEEEVIEANRLKAEQHQRLMESLGIMERPAEAPPAIPVTAKPKNPTIRPRGFLSSFDDGLE